MSVSNVNARLIAVKALCRVECDEAYSNIVLNTTKEIELIERKHNDTFNEQNKTNY